MLCQSICHPPQTLVRTHSWNSNNNINSRRTNQVAPFNGAVITQQDTSINKAPHRCLLLRCWDSCMRIVKVWFGPLLVHGQAVVSIQVIRLWSHQMIFDLIYNHCFPFLDTIQSSALPTPPGSESSYDTQYTTLHHQVQKPSDAFTNLVSAYGSYSSAAVMEYQSAMTPPSSVSPRDSSSHHGKPHGGNSGVPSSASYDYISSVYSEQSESSLPPLPLKPQAYSAAAAMHHSSIADSYSAIDQSQYFPHPTGFHLYHKGQGWYSTPT